ncbi:hypothetical protein [Amycolatopsis ultiminotia]|uniref:hypothetical protein n=1 Tax=Amycolatopsis ultiminotia TaxID=543629 RepID=UPI0031EFAC28
MEWYVAGVGCGQGDCDRVVGVIGRFVQVLSQGDRRVCDVDATGRAGLDRVTERAGAGELRGSGEVVVGSGHRALVAGHGACREGADFLVTRREIAVGGGDVAGLQAGRVRDRHGERDLLSRVRACRFGVCCDAQVRYRCGKGQVRGHEIVPSATKGQFRVIRADSYRSTVERFRVHPEIVGQSRSFRVFRIGHEEVFLRTSRGFGHW